MLHATVDDVQAWFDSRQTSGGGRLVTLEVLEEGRLVARRRPHEFDLRPGGVINGVALVGFVDAIGWMMAVAHQPPGSDAFTADLSMQFLRGAPVGDLWAELKTLRMRGRTAIFDATVTSPTVAEGPVAHAVLTFVLTPAP
jgi:acyl-coenzyme A thioesterase PaaI-like protein